MLLKTPLYPKHLALHAKLVDFAGWEMPLHYGSQIAEHHAVRKKAGVFDVSHMGVIELKGRDSTVFLRYLLANDIAKLKNFGRAIYSCLLNPKGGILDDLIVYKITEEHYWVVVNAATREKDLSWFQQQSKSFSLTITPRSDLGILAVQGPEAFDIGQSLFNSEISSKIASLKPFHCVYYPDHLIGRTGYTGEDGLELIMPSEVLLEIWDKLIEKEVKPCGLGARDTLRLEAGLNLYGTDMDEKTTPFESNLAWTVCLDDPKRNFIGKEALQQQLLKGVLKKLIGVKLRSTGVLRNHQPIFLGKKQIGEITSGGFSPTLGYSIAFARISAHLLETQNELSIVRREEQIEVERAELPFVNRVKKTISQPIST